MKTTSLPLWRPAAVAAACTLMAACGGGGSDDTSSASTATEGRSGSQALNAGPALEAAPSSLSGNVTCRNLSIGAARLDSVIVPDDAACRLEGTSLIGNIVVGRGAMLIVAGVSMNGSVQAEGAANVALSNSAVGGSVQIKQGSSAQVEACASPAICRSMRCRGRYWPTATSWAAACRRWATAAVSRSPATA